MSYDALTIDTNVVYTNSNFLSHGLVGQLDQFKDGLVKFLLSEIIILELFQSQKEKAKKSLEAMNNTIKICSLNGHLNEENIGVLKNVRDTMQQPEELGKQKIDDFLKFTGAEVISADQAQLKSIINKYFNNEPPFGKGKKKNEFPDAIALLSLEDWADKKKKKILAVSKDKDWKSFAEQSDNIDVVEDLGEAMVLLNDLSSSMIPAAKSILSDINALDQNTISFIDSKLEYAVETADIYLSFDSYLQGEIDAYNLSLVSYVVKGSEDDSTEIDIVRVGSENFAFRIPVKIMARVDAEINFYVKDSIDRDYVYLGNNLIEEETSFDAYLLLECNFYLNDPDDQNSTIYKIDKVELIGIPFEIDIGYIDNPLADDFYE
jgi:hypothetical protein